MKKERLHGQDLLKAVLEKFDYRSETGKFLYKKAWGHKRVGDVAGHNHKGYRMLCLKDNNYYIHILVYLVENGFEAPDQIDHRDHNRSNNHISNLRACSCSENRGNVDLRKDNTSGYRGVYSNKRDQNWKAQITVNGKVIHLGSFTDILEAAATYEAAALKHFGKFYFKAS